MKKSDEITKTIETVGLKAQGKRELLKHLCGEKITFREMAIAKCYDCMGYYSDGISTDCRITECPLYPAMPYGKKEVKVSKGPKKVLSEEQRVRMSAARWAKIEK